MKITCMTYMIFYDLLSSSIMKTFGLTFIKLNARRSKVNPSRWKPNCLLGRRLHGSRQSSLELQLLTRSTGIDLIKNLGIRAFCWRELGLRWRWSNFTKLCELKGFRHSFVGSSFRCVATPAEICSLASLAAALQSRPTPWSLWSRAMWRLFQSHRLLVSDTHLEKAGILKKVSPSTS